MLDQVLIFARSGVVLWSKTFCKLKENPVDKFISTIVIPEKGGDHRIEIDQYQMKWVHSTSKEIDLFYLVERYMLIYFILIILLDYLFKKYSVTLYR